MNFIRRLLLLRDLRRTPHHELVEQHELLIRLARRCAYDFSHATDFVPTKERPQILWLPDMDWSGRARHWIRLFQSGNPAKDYRHELHRRISELEIRVELYQRLLAEHGIQDPHGGDIPF